jgi:hypothetical protein
VITVALPAVRTIACGTSPSSFASPAPHRHQSTCSSTGAIAAAAASSHSHRAGRKFGSKVTIAPAARARRATSTTSSRGPSPSAIVMPVRCTSEAPSSASDGTSAGCIPLAAEPLR